MIPMDEIAKARERGRLMAARRVAADPEAKKRVEDAVGPEMARRIYPEAYASGADSLFDIVASACKFPENPLA